MNTITLLIPYFLLSFLFIILSNFIVKYNVFFYKKVHDFSNLRYESIDGLRGFLSLNVFFHHSVISYYYFQSGIWKVPPSAFYTLIGESAVCFFFMITGFLFWSKAIYNNGKFDFKSLYISRLSRILPMYLFSIFWIFCIVLLISGFNLRTDLLNLILQVFRWLASGLLGAPDINGINASLINARVTWTLGFEWIFYLFLPLLAVFHKPLMFVFLFAIFLLFQVINPNIVPLTILTNFFFGMAVAHIVNYWDLKKICSTWWSSLISILILLTMPFIFSSSYSILASTLIFVVFASFVYGNNLFGLLTTPASKYLGTVSYSIYLLHGIVLFVVLNVLDKFYPINRINSINYWLIIGFCGLIVILLSGVTYRFVEHPFIRHLGGRNQLPKKLEIANLVGHANTTQGKEN